MDPITLIPYTIFIVAMTGFWVKDEMFSIKNCQTGHYFKHKDSVYKCEEDQRLMYRQNNSQILNCEEMECEK